MPTETREVVIRAQDVRPKMQEIGVKFLLDKYKQNIASVLQDEKTVKRMIGVATNILQYGSEQLQRCDPQSVLACVIQSSILGLELGPLLGEAYLVPFWNSKARIVWPNPNKGKPGEPDYFIQNGGDQAQFMPGYKGLVKLARNTGLYALIDAQPVYENDEFEAEKGFNPVLRHKRAPGDRGRICGYYGAYVLKDGGANFEYMTVEEINEHRDKYSKGAYKTRYDKDKGEKVYILDANGNRQLQGPWKDSPDWMYRKTPLKQVLKLAPSSVNRLLQVALGLDDQNEAGIMQTYDLPDELAEIRPQEIPAEEPPPQLEEPKRKSAEAKAAEK